MWGRGQRPLDPSEPMSCDEGQRGEGVWEGCALSSVVTVGPMLQSQHVLMGPGPQTFSKDKKNIFI